MVAPLTRISIDLEPNRKVHDYIWHISWHLKTWKLQTNLIVCLRPICNKYSLFDVIIQVASVIVFLWYCILATMYPIAIHWIAI